MKPYAKNFCPPLCPRIGLGCNYECENAEPDMDTTHQPETQQNPTCTSYEHKNQTIEFSKKRKDISNDTIKCNPYCKTVF